MKLEKSKTNCLVITHFVIRTNQGPAAPSIFAYLLKETKRVVYIELPFPHAKIQSLYLSIYEGGSLHYQKVITNIKGPTFLQYIYHIFISAYFLILSGLKFDICIACENLSLISIVLFRKIGFIKKIVYYSIDYTDNRFGNFFMNKIYHLIDKYSCQLSDINWVVTKQQIQARAVKFDINNCSPFEIVPIGYDLEEFNKIPVKKISSYQLAYAGAFLEHNGVQLAIKALSFLKTKHPKIKLLIMGSGSYERKLRDLISRLKISKYVKFLGHVEDFFDLISILKGSTIGLAPFLPTPGSVSFNADSSKIKLYLSCGLPVIATSVTTIAPILEKKQAGIIAKPEETDISKAIDYLLSKKIRYEKFKRNAVLLSKNYDINHILKKAFDAI